jgi:POT family proton-dependent oligopeptide transporter
MTTTANEVADASVQQFYDTSGLAGHPRGLSTLFFTEMWERFSFYGLRAILVLYMVASPRAGGLGFDTPHATAVFGNYLAAAYLLSLPGGVIADRVLGARRAVLFGGVIIACGHFAMAVPALPTFYIGLTLIACGTGLLKPNVSALVGELYPTHDTRRDSGFSLFYMGINIGAFLAPLVCGYLAEADGFKALLRVVGISPLYCWRFGFGAAGVGMSIGLLVFWLQRDRVRHNHRKTAHPPVRAAQTPQGKAQRLAIYAGLAAIAAIGSWHAGSHWQAVLPFLLAFDALVLVIVTGFQEQLSILEWKRLGAMGICFIVSTAFWCAYEQKGASLTLLTRDLVNRHIGNFLVPAAWFQSLTALYVILMVPVFAALWAALGHRQPSTLAKMALAPMLIGIGYAAFALVCASLAFGDKISPLWMAGLFLFDVFGELCLSPIGLNLVTRLAPVRLVGLTMGLWFFGSSFGYKLAGFLAGFYLPVPGRLALLYGGIAASLFAIGGLFFALLPAMRELVSEKSAEKVVNAQ